MEKNIEKLKLTSYVNYFEIIVGDTVIRLPTYNYQERWLCKEFEMFVLEKKKRKANTESGE